MYLRVLVVGTGAGGDDYRPRRLRLGFCGAPRGLPRPPMWLTGAIEAAFDLSAASAAEVRNRGSAADTLNPDVLDPGDVGCDVLGRDDHLRGEGLVVPVTRAVEV